MSIDCEVIPKLELKGEQLRKLGRSLLVWSREAWTEGFFNWIDEYALDDLAKGDLPRPMIERLTRRLQESAPQAADQTPLDLAALRRSLGSEGQERTVLICAREEAGEAAVADSLRRCIPAALVKDVLINGRSWLP